MRITQLRECLAQRGLAGFLLPKTDEYQNEYNAPCAERVRWLTGFDGSAGLVLCLAESAVLFVDGRYTLQARHQVDEQVFEIAALTPEVIRAWLQQRLKAGDRLGYDPRLHTERGLTTLAAACDAAGASLVPVESNPVDALWHDRPPEPATAVVEHPLQYAGERSGEKCQRLAATLGEADCDAFLVTQPDCIAWLLNIRACDVPCVPLALSYAVLYSDGSVEWFIDGRRLERGNWQESRGHLRVSAPEEFPGAVQRLAASDGAVMADLSATPVRYTALVRDGSARVVDGNPVTAARARKNAAELEGARNAHRRDGAALTRALAWLQREAPGGGVTELDVVRRLQALRAAQPLFMEPSFDTIAGAGGNGAIVHYRVTEDSNQALSPGDLFLVDSGGQYLDGTTDVTRTVAVGEPAAEHRAHYTRVLRGHIALATCRFPEGTTGHQLDALARQPLWEAGLDYAHGTGHGVGSYLGVHEGPQSISPRPNATALQAGMIVSNEPGFYREGAYGIRIENLVAVREWDRCPGFLEFETLTLAPLDRRLIDTAALRAAERQWVDDYHRRVFEALAPALEGDYLAWLEEATAPLL